MSMKLELQVLWETSLQNDSLSLINWEIWKQWLRQQGREFFSLSELEGLQALMDVGEYRSGEYRKSQLYPKVNIDDLIGQSFSKCGLQTTYISTIWEWNCRGEGGLSAE